MKFMSVTMISFGHFYSLRLDQTAEASMTTASQCAVFGLHVKANGHFLPHSIVRATDEEPGCDYGRPLERRKNNE